MFQIKLLFLQYNKNNIGDKKMDKKIKALDYFKEKKEYNSFILLTTLANEKNIKEVSFYEKLLPIKQLSSFFGMTDKKVISEIKKMLNIKFKLRDLFSYEFIPCNTNGALNSSYRIKIADNAAYSTEYVSLNGERYQKTIIYDVYVTKNNYYNIAFNTIFREFFKRKYSILFDHDKCPFLFEIKNRFSDEEIEILSSLNDNSLMSMFDYHLNKYPLKLIYSVLKNKKKIHEKVYESKITLYFDHNYVYINLFKESLYNKVRKGYIEYDRSLYIPIEFFKTKDWALVENVIKNGEAYESDETQTGITFIKERQGDASYMHMPDTLKIKEVLLSL